MQLIICLLTGYSTIHTTQAENLQKLIGKNSDEKLNTNFNFLFPIKNISWSREVKHNTFEEKVKVSS